MVLFRIKVGHPIINLPCWCIPFYTSHLWWFPGWFIGFTTWTCEKYMVFVRILKVNEPTFWMLPHAKSASTSHQCCPRAQATFAWQTWQPGVMTHLSSTAAWRWDNDSNNTETKHKYVVIVSSEHLFFWHIIHRLLQQIFISAGWAPAKTWLFKILRWRPPPYHNQFWSWIWYELLQEKSVW